MPPRGSTWRVNWKGAELARRLRSASEDGIDDVMKAATLDAKSSHSGWQNKTGNAEGSIRIIDPAKADFKGAVGRWGSTGVAYFLQLEIKRGSALRNSAQANYPSLQRRIAFHMGGVL